MSESKTNRPLKVRMGGLAGVRAWRARKETHGTKETRRRTPCRTNYEGQAGRGPTTRKASWLPGVGLVHSSQRQGASPEAGEGANRSTQSAQETRTVRTTEEDWQTFLRAIAEKAYTDKHHRFGDLYRWLNQDVLRLCFFRLRKDAASGVDGVTHQEYEKNLEANLKDLEGRLRRKAYRARLVRRKLIPKGNGKMRPLGIPALEDKLVQAAVTQILLAIFEMDFLPCSYGYRPGMSAHDAIRALTRELQFRRYNFIYEADIRGSLKTSVDRLEEMLEQRIADGAIRNLIGKWLRAGILEEDGRVIHPQREHRKAGLSRLCWQTSTCTTSWTNGFRTKCSPNNEDAAGCSATRTTLWCALNIATKLWPLIRRSKQGWPSLGWKWQRTKPRRCASAAMAGRIMGGSTFWVLSSTGNPTGRGNRG